MGSIDIGGKVRTRNAEKQSIDILTASSKSPERPIDRPDSPPARKSVAELPKKQSGKCGAMVQQSGDSGWGNQSAPQKLLHLVGCREPKVRPEPDKRPGPAKR